MLRGDAGFKVQVQQAKEEVLLDGSQLRKEQVCAFREKRSRVKVYVTVQYFIQILATNQRMAC